MKDNKELTGYLVQKQVSPSEKIKNGVELHSRQRIIKNILAIFFILAIVIILYAIFWDTPNFVEKKNITIPQKTSANQIAVILKENNIIRSKYLFLFFAAIEGHLKDLRAGTYSFAPTPVINIISTLANGGEEITVTVPEGLNSAEIGAVFERKEFAIKNFRSITENSDKFNNTFGFLKEKPEGTGLEGYLFPDTYRVLATDGAEEIIQKMLENFSRKLNLSLRGQIYGQGKTIFEVITMASLLEKEASSEEDQRTIAGVLWKRVDLGIPLQVDATVIYAKARIAGFPNNILKKTRVLLTDTLIDSPYNTYRNRGLPTGPIANPGISAIRAAIHPKDSPYLYYLSTPDGRTIFSRTLEEHNNAKNKYLK